MITGACNLAFLFLVLSGFYLWLPRDLDVAAGPRTSRGSGADCRARRATSTGTTPSASGARSRSSIVVASGAVISYPWASDLVYRVAGETPPAARPAGRRRTRRGDRGGPVVAREPRPVRRVSTRHGRAPTHAGRGLAQHQRPHSRAGAETAAFTIDRGTAGQPQKRGTLTLNARDRRGREVGTVRVAVTGPPPALVPALRAHRRSVGPHGPDDRGTGVARRRVPGLDRHLARDPPVLGVACTRAPRRDGPHDSDAVAA